MRWRNCCFILKASQGDKPRQGKARQGKARQGKARRACQLRLHHLERRERRRRLTRHRLRRIHTSAASPARSRSRLARSSREARTASPPAASCKEAEHGGRDFLGGGLRVARLQICIKIQHEEAEGLGDGQKRGEDVNHGVVDALP